MDLVRRALVEELRLHPRVAQQGIASERAARERLAGNLPPLVPFGGRTLRKVVAILDWDHKLPSRALGLRLHAFYEAPSPNPESLAGFEDAFATRLEEIMRRNRFPEFDVPDFAELPADESYDADLSTEMDVQAVRLASPWRREVGEQAGEQAVRVVRGSTAFARARAAHPGRPNNLGDLEAVAWMSPCESGHQRWTLDVWWLTAFDGRIGRGWSFLVDPDAPVPADRVVSHREFTVRTG